MTAAARAYAEKMLRRDLRREPLEREIRVWSDWLEVSGALAPVAEVEPAAGEHGVTAEDPAG